MAFQFIVEMDSHTIEVPVLGDAKVRLDLRKLPNVSKVRVLAYGIGRFLRDGNSPDKQAWDDGMAPEYKNGDLVKREGHKLVSRPAADREAEAEALAQGTVEALYKGEVTQGRVGRRVDPLFDECRRIVFRALVARGVVRKAIPALPNTEAVQALCKTHGVSYDAVEKKARAVIAAADVSDLMVEVDAK